VLVFEIHPFGKFIGKSLSPQLESEYFDNIEFGAFHIRHVSEIVEKDCQYWYNHSLRQNLDPDLLLETEEKPSLSELNPFIYHKKFQTEIFYMNKRMGKKKNFKVKAMCLLNSMLDHLNNY